MHCFVENWQAHHRMLNSMQKSILQKLTSAVIPRPLEIVARKVRVVQKDRIVGILMQMETKKKYFK